MANRRQQSTLDIKLAYPATDMTPGPLGLQWERDTLLHGNLADGFGWTNADCFMRVDDGAVHELVLPREPGVHLGPGHRAPLARDLGGELRDIMSE